VRVTLPLSVELLCEYCFQQGESLTSIPFESESKLSRIEKWAFRDSGITSIHLLSSVEVLREKCLSLCHAVTLIPSPSSTGDD
jgi:hypothetical protein